MRGKRIIIFILILISILMLTSTILFSKQLGNALFLFYVLPGFMFMIAAYLSLKRNKENKS